MWIQDQMMKMTKYIGKYEKSDGRGGGDDNEAPEEGEEVVSSLLDDIFIDDSMVKYQNIEHQRTSYDEWVSEHKTWFTQVYPVEPIQDK